MVANELDGVDPPLPSYNDSRTEPIAQSNTALHTREVEHIRLLNNKSDAVLKFRSYASRPDTVPLFVSGQPILGVVELAFQKKTALKSVVVRLEGFRRSPRSDEDKVFMKLSQTLWPKASGAGAKHIDAGTYELNFSLSMPQTTALISNDGTEIALPPTFSDERSAEYIIYEMTFFIEKGMFSSRSEMRFPIHYLVRTTATPLHPALQAAYRERTALPDPTSCPEAWLTTSATVTGRLFAQREVTFKLQASLTAPKEYARGTFAHLHIAIETSDQQALDLLSTSGACGLTLVCHLSNYVFVKKGAPRGEARFKDVAANGRIWPGQAELDGGEAQAESETKRQVFWGEVPIPQDSRAGFAIPSISLHYTVDLKLTVTGLVLSPEFRDGIVLSVPVTVALEKAAAGAEEPRSIAPAPRYGEVLPKIITPVKMLRSNIIALGSGGGFA